MPDRGHVTSARAVFDASAEQYLDFVGEQISAATEGPLDRAVLTAFVEMVGAGRGGRVADLGCGPGRAAAYLASHGLDVVGFDVSPVMLDAARRAHPAIAFEEGALDRIPLPDASLVGIVCWYSIIYTPRERLGDAFAEMRRVLESDGLVLLAFQAGDGEGVHRPNAQGTTLPLTSFRHGIDDVTRRLGETGLKCIATARREPIFEHESTPQAFLIAHAAN